MRVGHLYRLPELLRAIGEDPSSRFWTGRSPDSWDGIPLSSMVEAAQISGLVSCLVNGEYSVSASGHRVLAEPTSYARFRRTVMELYVWTKPAWISLVPLGRQAVRAAVPPDDLQCLDESGLLADGDRDTVAWWDALGGDVRSRQDQGRLEIGRDAESLSLGYENWRTGTTPQWVAIESNLAGYDVLSQVSSSDTATLMIEVKGSSRSLATAVLILTRNEWNTMVTSSRAVLDAWLMAEHGATLRRTTVGLLSTLIPLDQSDGKWQTVTIPYSALPSPCARATWIGRVDGSYDYQDASAE